MRRDDVVEREQLLNGGEKAVPRRRARVALVAVLDGRPLVARHRARPRVREEVDQHLVRGQLEEVESTAATAARRSSSVVSRSGSTEWIRNGSMIVLKLKAGQCHPESPY
jgi:hypothetical protein